MSFDISWAAFRGVRKQDVLAVAGLRDVGEPDEANEALFSCAELPNDWTVLYVNNSTYMQDHAVALSENHAILSLTVQEFAETSIASFYVRGEKIWNVGYNGVKNSKATVLDGDIPPQAIFLRDQLLKPDSSKEEKSRVAPLYYLAINLAERICGYRHDRWHFAWGRPMFTIAEPRS